MRDGLGRIKLEKYFPVVTHVAFRALESERLFSRVDELRLQTIW